MRGQHAGPGFAYVTDETIEISGWKIVRVMLRHVWPKEQPSLKARVVIAVGLLFGAKVCAYVHILILKTSINFLDFRKIHVHELN